MGHLNVALHTAPRLIQGRLLKVFPFEISAFDLVAELAPDEQETALNSSAIALTLLTKG